MDPIKFRLRVTASAADKQALLERLFDQATAFFGDTEYVLDDEVNVEASVVVDNVQGYQQITRWEGDAWFVSAPT